MTTNIKTRFAPSPTGYLHIGSARTALYSYLWAKKHAGEFYLRIEDTDRNRYQADAEQDIYNGLRWLNLQWDGEVIHQSNRTAVYREHVQQLIEQGSAYYCFCTPERLDLMRSIQRKKNRAPKYDKTCLQLSAADINQKLQQKKPYVIRLNIPTSGTVRVKDMVRGNINFSCSELDDQVLLKSDGFPTYHLANVVDDYTTKITHVIRGEEWIPSTPKHVLLYQAFNWPVPTFAHLSLFINKGGGKLSKREGATGLSTYKKTGYLAEAIVNFIALLGWNPKTKQEIFNLTELIEQFDLTQINTANPIFDTNKLDWFNNHYLRKLPLEKLVTLCQPYLPAEAKGGYLHNIVKLEQERLKKLDDISALTDFFFIKELEYGTSLLFWKKANSVETIQQLTILLEWLNNCDDWTANYLETNVLQWIKEKNLDNGSILWPWRVALTGKKASPPPFAVAAILGKKTTLERINFALEKLNK